MMIIKSKVVAIDDNAFFLKAIKSLLIKDNSVDILNVFSSGNDFIKSVDFDNVDIVLLDIEMPVLDGFEIAKHLFEKRPDVKIIAVTMKHDQLYIDEFIRCGFAGYIYKPNAVNELQLVLAEVRKNNKYFPITED